MRVTACINNGCEDQSCGDKGKNLFHVFGGLGLRTAILPAIVGQTYYGLFHPARISTMFFYVKLLCNGKLKPGCLIVCGLKN
jgi:hypothetical protein